MRRVERKKGRGFWNREEPDTFGERRHQYSFNDRQKGKKGEREKRLKSTEMLVRPMPADLTLLVIGCIQRREKSRKGM